MASIEAIFIEIDISLYKRHISLDKKILKVKVVFFAIVKLNE